NARRPLQSAIIGTDQRVERRRGVSMHAVLSKALAILFLMGAVLIVRDGVAAAQPYPPPGPAGPVATVVSGAGDITTVVEQYRNLLGPNNGGEPGTRGTGRREINWDGVPDELSAPNFLLPDFFNDAAAP